jgi:hypothetical protein
VVSEDGDLYRLSYIDQIGRLKSTRKIIPFVAGPANTVSYDICIEGKIKRMSIHQLKQFYVEIKKENRRLILLPSDFERPSGRKKVSNADLVDIVRSRPRAVGAHRS